MNAVSGTSVLFVCLGNICRSPSAEAVLRARAGQAGIRLLMDSAGTGNWHVGQPPDERAIVAAAARGVAMEHLRARQVCVADFYAFTHILAMDRSNLADLTAMVPPGGTVPRLFLDMAPDIDSAEIPDPYYGDPAGFGHMLELIEQAAEGFLKTISQESGGRS